MTNFNPFESLFNYTAARARFALKQVDLNSLRGVSQIAATQTERFLPQVIDFLEKAMRKKVIRRHQWTAAPFQPLLDWGLLGLLIALFTRFDVGEQVRVTDWIGLGLQPTIGLGELMEAGMLQIATLQVLLFLRCLSQLRREPLTWAATFHYSSR